MVERSSSAGSRVPVAMASVLVWKIGKKQRLKTVVISTIVGIAALALAWGLYQRLSPVKIILLIR